MARSVNGFLGTFESITTLTAKYAPAEYVGCSANIGTVAPYTKAWCDGAAWNSLASSALQASAKGAIKLTSMSGATKYFAAAPFNPGAPINYTLATQIQAPATFTGFKLVVGNPYTAASTLSGLRVASPVATGNDGSALSYTVATFAGATSIVLPPAVGTDPSITAMTWYASDPILMSPASSANLLHVRYDFAGQTCGMQLAVGEMAAFNTASGYDFRVGNVAGSGSTAAITMLAGQAFVPGGVIWTFDRPARTIAVIGGSTTRGQGSEGNSYGYVTRACALKSSSSLVYTPYIVARSSANSTDAIVQATSILSLIQPYAMVIPVGSGNDAVLDAAGFEKMKGRVAQIIELCIAARVMPVLTTLPPSDDLSAPQELLRLAQNTWAKSLQGILCADVATAVENPTNRGTLLPAYDSGDGTHLNAAGHAVMASVLAATLV
jgi:lysophospholipase L1-like esterase